jgi:hypothetical protein
MLAHVLLCVSEVSFFFVSALATVAMSITGNDSEFVLWKAMLLASAIFAFFCYKRQLASVGYALLEIEREKTTVDRKESANYEKTPPVELPDSSGAESTSNLSRRAS